VDAQTSSKSTASSGKKTTGKSTQSGGKSKSTARRSPPRQTAPTAERYKEIQQALADKGFYTGPVNGEWGPESVAALKNFQEANNIAADGKLGSLSLIALGLGPKREPMNQLAGKPESAP
jgi:peptidoglycan hydrolase-like protein with peptidoglycan-binding domain